MKPKDLIRKQTFSGTDAKTLCWGLMLNCWDSYHKYRDLRSISPAEVKFLCEMLTASNEYINEEEKKWCRGIAEQDIKTFNEQFTNKELIKEQGEWSFRYATCTIVMRKLSCKYWNDPEGTEKAFAKKREEFEAMVRKTFGEETDWSLPEVPTSGRNGALERALAAEQ